MEVPKNLWATSHSDFGRIKNTVSIKTQIAKPLPKLPQYPLKSEAIQVCVRSDSWIIAHQAPLSVEFSRQEYWNGLPFQWVRGSS